MPYEFTSAEEAMEAIAAGKAYLKQHGTVALANTFKSALTGRVDALAWVQYTPYFNDGDPCVFGVRSAFVKIDGGWLSFYPSHSGSISFYREAPYWLKGESEHPDRLSWDDMPTEVVPAIEFLGRASKDERSPEAETLLQAFGDGFSVVATADGFTVEDCEHD